jgi:hypothetical protein
MSLVMRLAQWRQLAILLLHHFDEPNPRLGLALVGLLHPPAVPL